MKKELKNHLVYAGIVILLITFLSYNYYQINTTQESLDTHVSSINSKLNKIDQSLTGLSQEDTDIKKGISEIKGDVTAISSQLTEKGLQILTLTEDLQKVQEESTQLQNKISDLKAQNADFSDIIEESIPAVVSIRTNLGSGSGFLINQEGNIVTNYHVIEGATAAVVVAADGTRHSVGIVGYNKAADVALLDIDGENFDYLNFGNSDNLKVGERVIAIGNPGGFDFTVTQGIVSAVQRTTSGGREFVQIDVPINPGNSGGPLIDANGKVEGVNTLKIQDFEGIGFALSSNYVQDVVNEIKVQASNQ